ncbi:MAG TPA: methyltransferase domain-containing protein, partial [Caulobacteraceae bacterium]
MHRSDASTGPPLRPLSRLWRRITRPTPDIPAPYEFTPGAPVTQSDIGAAYKMLLGREPLFNEDYEHLTADPPTTAAELIAQIVLAPDFLSRHGAPNLIGDKRHRRAALDYVALFGDARPLSDEPARVPLRSSLCHQSHFALDQYRAWMKLVREDPRLHRKQWEYFFVAQALHERGVLKPGMRGLGFGVGREPLPAAFASFGATVVASDQSEDQAKHVGWVGTNEHSHDLSLLNDRGICPPEAFERLVSFQTVDMNDIPPDLEGQFDFCWSSCAFEHLGSLRHGIAFVKNAMKVLKPGGVAAHTTEFNLSSDDDTIDEADLAIY